MSKKAFTKIFEINQDIAKNLTIEQAQKRATNINFETIRAIERSGKTARALLMKNNQVAMMIESPLWSMYIKDLIDENEFAAGYRYSLDYFTSIRDSLAKQSWKSFARGYKNEIIGPNDEQIEASGRIYKIKRELDRVSQVPKKEVILNKRLSQLVELLIENESGVVEIASKMKIDWPSITKRLKEALYVIARCYGKSLQ